MHNKATVSATRGREKFTQNLVSDLKNSPVQYLSF